MKVLVPFAPWVAGLAWTEDPLVSVLWSLAGSVLIAGLAQTRWFRSPDDGASWSERLLRPSATWHLFFVAFHVAGGLASALATAGLGPFGPAESAGDWELAETARAQRLMLLAHAGVTAGMRLVGFAYPPPRYLVRPLPPYFLALAGAVALAAGAALTRLPLLSNAGYRLEALGTAAVLVEVVLALGRPRRQGVWLAGTLLAAAVVRQALSGWKGPVLYTALFLSLLVFPRAPRRSLLAGGVFVLVWALYFYPFGIVLRWMTWYQEVPQEEAIRISLDQALALTMEERLEHSWLVLVERASELWAFRRYLEYVPGQRPYYGLELVAETAMGLIPRALWPGKPDLEVLAMQRVYEAGVTREEAVVSAKANYYQEGYLSAGAWGVLTSALLFGMVMMGISRLCESLFGGYAIGTGVVYTGLFTLTFSFAGPFSFVVGATVMSLVVALAIFGLGRATGWVEPAGAAQAVGTPAAAARPG